MTGPVVVTLNTWKGDGAYRRRLALMTEGLSALAPDILLLQECLAAPEAGLDTARSLARSLGLHQAVWPGRPKPRTVEGVTVDSTSGVAVLSRFPIRNIRILDLPADPRDGERAALMAELDHPDGPILAVSLHLTHLPDALTLRGRQLATILTALPSDLPAILGGDFNAGLDAPEFRDLPRPVEDCRHLAGVPALPTLAGSDTACLDHILLTGTRFTAGSVDRVLDRPDADGILPSDHFGLQAMLAPA
jgi:endonuclease/exonuclease/phosphatase family metal-dependent hydrolase